LLSEFLIKFLSKTQLTALFNSLTFVMTRQQMTRLTFVMTRQMTHDGSSRTEAAMNNRFLLIFLAVVALTLLCGALTATIAIISPDPPPPFLDRAFNTCIGLFTLGVGAIFGLLGGRSNLSGPE